MEYGLDAVVFLTRRVAEFVRKLVSSALWNSQLRHETDTRDLAELHIKLSNKMGVKSSKPVVMRNG